MKSPKTKEIAVASVRDKWSTYPSNGLTPERLAAIFREADGGDIYSQAELFEEMIEKDAHLFSCLQTRRLAISGVKWEVSPASEEKNDQKIADFVRENLENLKDFNDDLSDILDSIGKGVSFTEIMWEVKDNQVKVIDLVWKNLKKFTFYDHNNQASIDVPRLLTDEHPVSGIPLPPNKFIKHRSRARSGSPSRSGLLRVVAWMYIFKNYDIKDWATFTEIFAMPIRIGKYSQNASKEDKEALLEAVISIGQDAAGVISEETMIEFVESTKTSSKNIYESLANFCNKEMSKAILGHTGSSESTPGKLGGENNAEFVRQDLRAADAKSLSGAIRWQLIKPLVDFNFGPQDKYPDFKFKIEPPKDLKTEAEKDKIVIVDMGLPVEVSYLYKKYNIPEPKEGNDLLVVPIGQAMPMSEALALKDSIQRQAVDQQNTIAGFYENEKKKRMQFTNA